MDIARPLYAMPTIHWLVALNSLLVFILGDVHRGNTDRSLQWITAPHSVLVESYHTYELCVLNLDASKYDIKKSIHLQPACEHLKDPWFESIPHRCWLGSRQQRIDDGVCVAKRLHINCRPLQNRTGFWKHWANLPPPVYEGSRATPASQRMGYAGITMKATRAAGFEILGFAGDRCVGSYPAKGICDY